MRSSRTFPSMPLARIRLVVLALCPLVVSCGGGGGATAPAARPNALTMPQGLWQGTMTDATGMTRPAQALVLANGEAHLKADATDLLQFRHVNGVWQGRHQSFHMEATEPHSTRAASFAVHSANPHQNFSGTYTVAGADPRAPGHSGTFTFNTYDRRYDLPLDPAILCGTYRGHGQINRVAPDHANSRARTGLELTLRPDGSLVGSSSGSFALEGRFTIPDPSKAALRVSMTVIHADGSTEPYEGLGYLVAEPHGIVWDLNFTAFSSNRGVMVYTAFRQ